MRNTVPDTKGISDNRLNTPATFANSLALGETLYLNMKNTIAQMIKPPRKKPRTNRTRAVLSSDFALIGSNSSSTTVVAAVTNGSFVDAYDCDRCDDSLLLGND